MQLRYIDIEGDAYEIGRTLGQAGAYAFRHVVPGIGRFQALQREWLGSDRVAALESAARQAYPEFVREIEGIAEGAGVAFEDVFLWNCRGDLPGGGDQSHADSPGCTTLLLPSADGGPATIAHNEDDQAELDGYCALVRVRPRHGTGYLSFYSPCLLPGHTFGVNAAGLVQTINHIRPRDQRVGVPRHLVARAVLGATTLDAALEALARDDRASGFHHNLGQVGCERILSVEAPASRCSVQVVDRPRAHANHLVFVQNADIQQEVAPSSARRQQRAEALIESGTATGRGPLAVLGDDAGELPICRKRRGGPDPGYTLATAVFRIGGEGVDWEVHEDPRQAPVHRGRVVATHESDAAPAIRAEGAS